MVVKGRYWKLQEDDEGQCTRRDKQAEAAAKKMQKGAAGVEDRQQTVGGD